MNLLLFLKTINWVFINLIFMLKFSILKFQSKISLSIINYSNINE